MSIREPFARRHSIEAARNAGRALKPKIAESWSRCEKVVAPDRSAAPVDAGLGEVKQRWEASPIRRSGVGLEEQLTRAADVGDLVAAVTDEEGRILWSAGGRTMRRIAERAGFVPGGRWDEASAGTNALALALRNGEPSTVFSAEHWCESLHDWVCWSVPVRDRSGRTVGVIDLSGVWDQATPLAEMTVTALCRLVEGHLPDPTSAPPTLEIRLLGQPGATLGGRPLSLRLRQIELLAALAIRGPLTLAELQDLVFGERAVSPVTVKVELSRLRQMLGGAISSRPYRLTLPVHVDVLEVRAALDGADLDRAVAAYRGQLISASEAPFVVDERHVLDATLRNALLATGAISQLLAYAAVHPYDAQVLQRAVRISDAIDPRHHEAKALLDIAGS